MALVDVEHGCEDEIQDEVDDQEEKALMTWIDIIKPWKFMCSARIQGLFYGHK